MATPDRSADGSQATATRPGKQVHHGRTGASWFGSILALVAFILGGIAVILQNWVLFAIAVVLLLVAGIGAKLLQRAGHGAN